MVRLQPEHLAALDAWIARQPEPRPSRPEAIRRLVHDNLRAYGYSSGSAGRRSSATGAKKSAEASVDQALKRVDATDEAKEQRKRRLTGVPSDVVRGRAKRGIGE